MTTGIPPYHPGELAVQARAGSADRARLAGERAIRSFMPDQHREFFAQLPFLVAAALDAGGQPWATLLAGPPGFAAAPTPQHLTIAGGPIAPDPLAGLLSVGRPIGLLGIQPHTRRRNRLNGSVAAADASGLTILVQQSFGNCPKYIQAREVSYAGGRRGTGSHCWSDVVDPAARRLISAADTFFFATAHPGAEQAGSAAEGVDVSHRGGRPGFVHVDADGVLSFPDFAGNGYFNTLGNLALEPRACLLFVDFAAGSLLHVAGEAATVWEEECLARYPGAERVVRLRPTRILRQEGVLPLAWGTADEAPQLVATGPWLAGD